MILSGLGLCASMAVIPFARSYATLLLFFLLLRVFASFYHPIVIAWISKSRAGSGRELDDAMGIQSGSGNLGRRPGLPDGRLPGPALGLEDAALRLGAIRPRPGRPRRLGPAGRLVAERGAAVPPAARPGRARSGRSSGSCRGSSSAGAGWSVAVYLRPVAPQPQVRHPHGADGPVPGPVDRIGDRHRVRLRHLEPPVRPQERLHGQPGRRRRGALPSRLRPDQGPGRRRPPALRRLPPHDLPLAPHLRRLDRPGLRPDHGLQLGQQHPARSRGRSSRSSPASCPTSSASGSRSS